MFSEQNHVSTFLIKSSEIALMMQITSKGGDGALIMHSKMHSYAPTYKMQFPALFLSGVGLK